MTLKKSDQAKELANDKANHKSSINISVSLGKTNDLWFGDEDEEEQDDRHHQNLRESMTSEVADRSQLKKLSQMLVYRKQKVSGFHSDGNEPPLKKAKNSRKSVTIEGGQGDQGTKKRKGKKRRSTIGVKKGTKTKGNGKKAFLTDVSPEKMKIGHGKYVAGGESASTRIARKAKTAAAKII
jgi:hypothetical protein